FSNCDYEPVVLKEILRGAVDVLRSVGATLVGGHCIDDRELKFGLSVTGILKTDKILSVSGAKTGDILVITKPIGIGIITTALKGRKANQSDVDCAVRWMLTQNKEASERALAGNAHACTDVTGFGLLGHALNMVKNSDKDIIIEAENIPVLDNSYDYINMGMVPVGAYNNLRFLQDKVIFDSNISEEQRLVFSDPQTSGGLIIAMQREHLHHLEGIFHKIIGSFVEGSGRIFVK
ncbi:MAG: selenide, water dikinase SelD, partial [Thermodesulfovibrionales bacterium]